MKTKLLLTLTLLVCALSLSAQQLAFPGAQGWGRFATGGRTGTVYHVTNLNDSGTGSLRDAVSQSNRIVVFDVGGVIRINSRLVFKSNLTIAGQTAPGEGITVYGDGMSCSGATNVIMRYMRFRMGSVGTKDADCAGLANGGNIIFDHCSFAWGQDENFSINWDNKGTAPHDVTLQNSIVGQGLMQHSAGGLIQADNITMYRVLLCDNKTRNFKVKGKHQYVNNIVYNWSAYAYEMGGESSGDSYANAVGNLFINGNSTGTSANGFSGGNSNFHFYGADNWQDRNKDGIFNPELFTGDGGSDRQSTPYDYPELETWSGKDLIEKLLPEVGASLPYRDLTDAYMVNEVLSFGKKGNLITSEKDLPYGTPDTWTTFKGTKPQDTDGDGMPDAWEEANGTDKTKNDAMTLATNGYANIENYFNAITKSDRQFFLRAPMLLTMTASTTNSITLEWSDFTDNEEGFIVEMKKDGAFTEIGRTAANVSTFTYADEALTPATSYVVRVCAYQGEQKSDYTAELTAKTRPEQIDIIDAENFQGTGAGEWLINPTTDETCTLSEGKEYTAVVVRSDANVTLNGTGYIGGTASLNKTGQGTLVVASDQHYTGATVLHHGVYEFSSLKNGDVASGLGKSQEFAQNWVMDGGVYKYTGPTTATNRSASLYNDTELNISKSGTVVTMNGSFEGQGNLTVDGAGQMLVNNANFFNFDGNLVLKGGEVKLSSKDVSDKGLGKASKLVLQGGAFTAVGKNEANVTYNFPIEVVAGTTSSTYFDLWNTNKCTVTGTGTLEWGVTYLREYIEGNWDGFTGQLVIKPFGNNGTNRQFAIRNNVGIKNATIYLKSGAAINGAKNESTYYLGGLSGEAGSVLAGFNVKAKGSGTWVVGGANTDEEFNGVINNNDQAGSHPGTTNIVKEGTGDWRLTGANVYAGKTDVNAGTLIVNGKHTGTGAVTVKAAATLAGKGTLDAATTVNGTLQVGDTLATDKGLTFNGGLKLGNAAVLQLNEAMTEKTYYNGDQIQAFTGTVTGTFAKILPETPGEGQTWDTTELYTKGILKVLGGTERDPDPTPGPGPQSETKKVCIAWGNCTRTGGDSSCTELVGNEESPSNNLGFSMHYTTVTDKYFSKGEKMTYDFDGVQRTGIKLSNGAQVGIKMPEGYKATKVTFWSTTTNNASSRTCYWKEVAGKTYTEADGQLLSLTATASSPSKAEFVLDNVQNELTFTNSGEQQQVIVVLEYHTGGSDTPEPTPEPVSAELSFNTPSVSAILGETFTAPTLQNPHNVAVTWGSSNAAVATVSQQGAVSVVGVGTTTISATFAGNADYLAGSASYLLTVTEPVPDAINSLNIDGRQVEYFTTSGERVSVPAKGIYVLRETTADGRVTSRIICR
ncbi:MAG: autotransporter-associated beta strand repeat-containing protein [Prevotella sp.]|nr:autotransporter-associated beta strand repeat-containing protein [Prevotella sp.]